MTEGYIYCLSNPLFPNLLKIGMTERTPEERLREANSCTWCPRKFELEFAKKVNNPREKERGIHSLLEKYRKRENPSREFFEVPVEEVKAFFDLIDGEYYTTTTELNTINPINKMPFYDGQRIRHLANGTNYTWNAIYNKEKDVIIHNQIEYRSLNRFALSHYTSVGSTRTAVNAWTECEGEKRNGDWVIADFFRNYVFLLFLCYYHFY